MRWLLDHFEQINAMPERRKTVVDEAVKYLSRGESVYTAPEGDIQEPFHLGRFYPGVARIYRRTGAPIIPIALLAPRSAMRACPRLDMTVDGRVYRALFVLRGPFCVNIGEPFTPLMTDGADEVMEDRRIVDELRERMGLLVEEIRINRFWNS
jgi:1-acyl-sn-glycerol-3-phosphate acyltransferase